MPLTHALNPLRELAAHASGMRVWGPAALALGLGAGWLGAAHQAFSLLARHGVRAGTAEFVE